MKGKWDTGKKEEGEEGWTKRENKGMHAEKGGVK